MKLLCYYIIFLMREKFYVCTQARRTSTRKESIVTSRPQTIVALFFFTLTHRVAIRAAKFYPPSIDKLRRREEGSTAIASTARNPLKTKVIFGREWGHLGSNAPRLVRSNRSGRCFRQPIDRPFKESRGKRWFCCAGGLEEESRRARL